MYAHSFFGEDLNPMGYKSGATFWIPYAHTNAIQFFSYIYLDKIVFAL